MGGRQYTQRRYFATTTTPSLYSTGLWWSRSGPVNRSGAFPFYPSSSATAKVDNEKEMCKPCIHGIDNESICDGASFRSHHREDLRRQAVESRRYGRVYERRQQSLHSMSLPKWVHATMLLLAEGAIITNPKIMLIGGYSEGNVHSHHDHDLQFTLQQIYPPLTRGYTAFLPAVMAVTLRRLFPLRISPKSLSASASLQPANITKLLPSPPIA